MIRDLVEENEALRKAGADFGRLAERLNLALQEERLRARDQSGRRAVRSSIRKPKPLVSDDAVGRWSADTPGLQTLEGSPHPVRPSAPRGLSGAAPARGQVHSVATLSG